MTTLVSLADFEARVEFDVDAILATSKLDDASALVRAEAGGELDDVDESNCPAVIVPVVVSAARRALVNPDGHGDESVDDYRTGRMRREGVFLTRDEKRTVRRWAGVLSVGTAQLEGYLPIPETEPVGAKRNVGWNPADWDETHL